MFIGFFFPLSVPGSLTVEGFVRPSLVPIESTPDGSLNRDDGVFVVCLFSDIALVFLSSLNSFLS
jgi:hypothetical protein